MINIFNKANKYLEKREKKLFVVINSINPDIMFPTNKEKQNLKNLLKNDINILKNFFNEKNIRFYDFNKKIENEYNEKNIDEIFNEIRLKWDHYTPKGYNVLAQEILKLIN